MTVHAPTPPIAKSEVVKAIPRSEPAKAKDWWIETATDRASFDKHRLAWDQLAKSAIEPNAFYEPWMFLPAYEAFGQGVPMVGAFVYRRDPRPKHPPQLCGFFPLERRTRFKGLPIRSLRLWEHLYAFLCTPLVHRDWALESLNAFFDWIATDERPSLLDFPKVNGDGPFQHALLEVMNERRMLAFADEVYARALIQRATDAETYCALAMSHGSRKDYNRQRRRLGEQGDLRTRVLQPSDDVEPWISQFLDLEASGWKGKERTALATNETGRDYFHTIMRNAHAQSQLRMLGLYLNDRPIALSCDFLTQDGGFAFKIAFDECYAKSSPGVLLELDGIADLHRRPGLRWVDSCAIPGHPMINRLWKERRTIQSLVLATSRWTGNGIVGVLPMLRACKRMWK